MAYGFAPRAAQTAVSLDEVRTESGGQGGRPPARNTKPLPIENDEGVLKAV